MSAEALPSHWILEEESQFQTERVFLTLSDVNRRAAIKACLTFAVNAICDHANDLPDALVGLQAAAHDMERTIRMREIFFSKATP